MRALIIQQDRRSDRTVAWMMWTLITLFSMYKFATQTSYAVVNSSIAEAMSLGLAQIGTLGAVYTFAFAVMTIPSGALLDHYGARRTLPVAAAIVSAGALIFANATTWLLLVIGQFFMGAGGAFGFPGAGYITRHWFPLSMFGILFGLTQSLVTLSTAVIQGGLGYLILEFQWREILMCLALVGGLLMIAMAIVFRDRREILARSRSTPDSFWSGLVIALREILLSKGVWSVTIPGAMAFSVLLSLAVLWGIKLLVAHGIDMTTASTINATIWIGFAIGVPTIAFIAVKMKSFKIPFVGCLIGLLLSIAGLLLLPQFSLVSAYSIFFSTGFFSGVCMLSFMATTQICRDVIAGTAIAVVNMIMFALSGLMMSIPAKLLDSVELTPASLREGLLVLPAGMMVALVIGLYMEEMYRSVPE